GRWPSSSPRRSGWCSGRRSRRPPAAPPAILLSQNERHNGTTGHMRSLFVCLFSLTLAVPAAAQNTKLTTVLADLVRAQASAGGTAALSAAAMPPSAQDAIRGRRLRIDANNDVQVYILLSAVTDATVAQLTAAGVTIEIRDEARRRVQARLPVSRLQAV